MNPNGKKKYKGGSVFRYEPQGLTLVNSKHAYRVSFEQAGCMRFCEKLQGYNVHLTKQFSLNFNGVSTTIARITFPVSGETISTTTKIPM
jgi:hypothetical protein